jgi:uncharacterized membrane protein
VTLLSSPASAEALDSLWRIELLHPVVVHYPVALITVGAVLWLVGRAVAVDGPLGYLRPAASTLLVLGAVGAWAAVLSGFWADDVVGPSVPNAPLLKDHENLAIATAVLATVLAAVEMARCLLERRGGPRAWATVVRAATLVLLLSTVSTLGLAAHHGAALVYAEGAAVIAPGH